MWNKGWGATDLNRGTESWHRKDGEVDRPRLPHSLRYIQCELGVRCKSFCTKKPSHQLMSFPRGSWWSENGGDDCSQPGHAWGKRGAWMQVSAWVQVPRFFVWVQVARFFCLSAGSFFLCQELFTLCTINNVLKLTQNNSKTTNKKQVTKKKVKAYTIHTAT